MTFTAYNGVPIPYPMYGTAWKKEKTAQLVERAVLVGFQSLDTANQIINYDEAQVGDALLALAVQGGSRELLFLQTKFTLPRSQGNRAPYDIHASLETQVVQSFESSLGHLRTNYIDSYLLHGLYSRTGVSPEDWVVWSAMEKIYQEGNVNIIGVSNVNVEQLRQLSEKANVKPMVVQNLCCKSMDWDYAVRKICRENKIIYQGFSLMTGNQDVLNAPEVRAIAQRVGVGPQQVIFRFALQLGVLPLIGTTNVQRMKEAHTVENFELTCEEMEQIKNLQV
ncbi:MAG: D-xylose reductase III [marine bacterium B5-7]|nr:MAG: D-xylose reductase III [marine bacterium B5-7]